MTVCRVNQGQACALHKGLSGGIDCGHTPAEILRHPPGSTVASHSIEAATFSLPLAVINCALDIMLCRRRRA